MTLNRILLIALAATGAIIAACILVYQVLTTGRLDPLALLFMAAVISMALPMLRANFFPSVKDCQAEFDFHVRRRDVFVRQQITDKLGLAALDPIHADQRAEAGLLNALENIQHRADEDLRFALLSGLAQHYERRGDPDAAIRCLTEAHQSRPGDFITRFQLARNYEWREDRTQALQTYRQILEAPEELSRAMRRLTRQRIEDLENHGINR